VCQPVDEFGPNVKLATTVFVPGLARNSYFAAVDPAPFTWETTEPVAPVAIATPVNISDAAMIEKPTAHFVRVLDICRPPFDSTVHEPGSSPFHVEGLRAATVAARQWGQLR
jgi:hypothetical protein